MKYIDRSYGVAVACFIFGAIIGALAVLTLPNFYEIMSGIVDARVLAPVQGWIAGQSSIAVIPLSWVTVQARNGTTSRSVPSLDGFYDGIGAINVPGGTYNVTFSVAFYQPQTALNIPVQWGGDYPVLPPQGFLCPTIDPSVCRSASPAPHLSSLTQAPTNNQSIMAIPTLDMLVTFANFPSTCARSG